MKILIADYIGGDIHNRLLNDGHDVTYWPELDTAGIDKLVVDYDVLVVRATNVNKAPKKCIIKAGTGTNNIKNISEKTRMGVAVCNTPGNGEVHIGNSNATAEACLGSMYLSILEPDERLNLHFDSPPAKSRDILNKLVLLRNLQDAIAHVNLGQYNDKSTYCGNELFYCDNRDELLLTLGVESPFQGLKFGIISANSAVAKLLCTYLKAAGAEIHVEGRSLKREDVEKKGFIYHDSIEGLISASDILSIHTSLNDKTKGYITDTLLKLMEGKTLFNFARGQLVSDSIKDHLQNNKLKYVLDEEPEALLPFKGIPNFIGTPHLGSETFEARDKIAVQVYDVIDTLDKFGAVMQFNCVNKDFVGYSAIELWLSLKDVNPASKISQIISQIPPQTPNLEEKNGFGL